MMKIESHSRRQSKSDIKVTHLTQVLSLAVFEIFKVPVKSIEVKNDSKFSLKH